MDTGVKVGDAMSRNPLSTIPSTTVKQCCELMKDRKVGSILLKDGEALVGIVTERDVARRCVAVGKDPEQLTAGELSTEHVLTITSTEDIFYALQVMQDHDIRHLPVVDEGKLVGFITVKDVLKIQPDLFEILHEKIEQQGWRVL